MATPAFRQNSSMGSPFDPNRSLEQSPPSLYPPRQLPKVLSRATTRREFDHVYSHERAIQFSGFKIEPEGLSDDKYSFRKIIGKQQLLQELDLDAQLTPIALQQLKRLTTRTVTSETSQRNTKARGKKQPDPPSTSETITVATNQYQITSNHSLVLTGSAMWTFPAELRTFFFRLASPISDSPIDRKSPLSIGLGLHRHPTPLGPCRQMDLAIPAHLSTLFELKKRNMFTRLASQFSNRTTLNLPSKYEARIVQPPASVAAKAEAKRRKMAKQLKKMLQDEEGQEGDETSKREKRQKDDDEEGVEEGSDVNEEESEGDSEGDTDFGEVHDDDDDDYGAGASGDDEPTF